MRSHSPWSRLARLLLVLGVLMSVPAFGGQAAAGAALPSAALVRQAALQLLIARAQQQGPLRVIIRLNTAYLPEPKLPGKTSRTQQRQRISDAQDRLLALLPLDARARARKMATIPIVAMELDAAELSAMGGNAEVATIQADVPVPPTLPESVPLIGGTAAWAAGFSGSGQSVAILDTGVDSSHTFLAAKIIAEACFSTTGTSSTTLCPNGLDQQVGSGAGINCTGIAACAHGTHVAGIAAGRNGSFGGKTFSGVAKDATLIPIPGVLALQQLHLLRRHGPVRPVVDIGPDRGSGLAEHTAADDDHRLREPQPWGRHVHQPGRLRRGQRCSEAGHRHAARRRHRHRHRRRKWILDQFDLGAGLHLLGHQCRLDDQV